MSDEAISTDIELQIKAKKFYIFKFITLTLITLAFSLAVFCQREATVEGEYTLTYSVTDKSGNNISKNRKVIVTERGKNGVIYLTFDDGPQSGTTDIILDVLKLP